MVGGIKFAQKGSFNLSKPAQSKRKAIFNNDDDEDDGDGDAAKAQPTAKQNGFEEITDFDGDAAGPALAQPQSSPTNSNTKPQPPHESKTSAKPIPPPSSTSRQSQQDQQSLSTLRSTNQATADVDESLYDYDNFLAARKVADRERKAVATSTKSNNHLSDLLAAAEQRKRDQDRARDKLLQKQRLEEGDEFKDKEAFVTEAYKANQEETRKAEEAEKLREEEERRRRETGLGMTAFHRKNMEEQDKRHREILEAAQRIKEKGGSAGVEALDEDDDDESELKLAHRLQEAGRHIEINENGEIADKRELLSGGLNIVAKPKPATQSGKDASASRKEQQQQYAGRSSEQTFGSNSRDSKRAMRQRQTKMIEAQLEHAAKHAAEQETEELEKQQRAAKSQKTQGDISSAKERYLQRKREAAAAAARGEG